MISKRSQAIDASGIRRVFDLGAKLKDPVNLSIGIPDFPVPDLIKAAAIRAIEADKNSYTQTQGIEALRLAIARRCESFGAKVPDGFELFVSSGVSGGILLSYMSLLDPGDEILIPDPYFVMYRDLATLINAEPRFYNTYPTFGLDVEAIERQITPQTKALLVNCPNNPTGGSATREQLKQVVELAKQKGLWLLSDEIYDTFQYEHPHVSILEFGYEKTILLNGFSKSLGVPGWRVGYVVAPKIAVDAMLKIQQYSFVCAPAPLQWGIAEGIDVDLSSILVSYREKRDFICAELKDVLEFIRPQGAFFLFPEAPNQRGQEFVERCIAAGLLVVPGNVFSRRDSHFRISFAAKQSQLERGVEIIRKLVKE